MTSLRLRLLAALTYVLLLAIIALGVPLAVNLSARVNAEVRTQAQGQADLVAATAADLLAPTDTASLERLANTAAGTIRGRILIVGADGNVLVDSAGPAQIGASYESRPEIQRALSGHQVQVQRNSRTLGQEILATAVPIIHDGRAVGAVRITQSVAALHGAVHRVEFGLALIALIVLALGLLAGTLIAAGVGRPIRRLEAVAQRVAHGDLTARAPLEGSREQRSLAASFNEMTDRVSRLLRAQRDFVADASHQLRTPLTGLRLRLEEAKALTSGPATHELDAAIAEVDRLAHTVAELLVLSRGGERRTTGAMLDLTELARTASQRWQPDAETRGCRLECAPGRSPATAWGARADIERSLDALVENALRYSPPGTTVQLAATPGRLEVRDRGPGIAADERELVFERFHRGRAGRAGPSGNGLGLSIARELAQGWGGDVAVDVRDGGGTVASITLPGERPTDGELPVPSGLPALNPPTASVS